MNKVDWKELIEKISKAANEKAIIELENMKNRGYQYEIYSNGKVIDQLYDLCGNSLIKFIDLRSSAYRSFKKYMKIQYNDSYISDTNGMFTEYPHFGRQELSFNKAITNTVADIINNEFGCRVVITRTYVD